MEFPTTANIGEGAKAAANQVTGAIDGVKTTVGNALGDFSSKLNVNAGSDFLQSNSVIAKFVFLILVLIGFLILLNLGIMLIGYFTDPPKSPYLVYGMIPGNSNMDIVQNPKTKNSVTILRSNNQTNGIEFTWSSWLFISGLPPASSKMPQYMNVFNKGSNSYDPVTGIALSNAPGMYIASATNTLHITMDTTVPSDTNTTIDISNVPLNKWFHIALRLQNTIMDVYVNGTIASRLNFTNVPSQNYYDVFVGANGGFPGYVSNLRYYDYALNVFELNNIVIMGPNTKAASSSQNAINPTGDYTYLSSSWYAAAQ